MQNIIEKESLQSLITYLEENLRASDKTRIKFIDPRGFRKRIITKQNHVVYGRRGAGKSLLVSSLPKEKDFLTIFINLEDYKDITFPNILVHVLAATFDQLIEVAKKRRRFKSLFFRHRLVKSKESLLSILNQPDFGEREIKTTTSHGTDDSVELGPKGVKAKIGENSSIKEEVRRKITDDKLDFLRKRLTLYKGHIKDVENILGNIPIFLVLDDLYFISKKVQPEFVDYLHRLTKGTNLFLKIATIKHRSKLYRHSSDLFIGIELNHDVFDIDLDYTLDKFSVLKDFMGTILADATSASGADISNEELFSDVTAENTTIASESLSGEITGKTYETKKIHT